MAEVLKAPNRRSLLKLFFALPFVRYLEGLFGLVGMDADAAVSEAKPLKVAKISELEKPWSTASFEYFVKVKGKNIKGDTVRGEHLPGLVIRLPDEIAQQRGGGSKGKYEVVTLYCTHQRCKTAFIADANEIQGMTGKKVANPVFYCPCHRSMFNASKGAVPMEGSQAKEPLWKFNFEVKGDDIVVSGVDPKVASWDPGRSGGLSSEYPVREGERGL